MKLSLKSVLKLCVLLLLIFSANAIGVGADPQSSPLLISKADTLNTSSKILDYTTEKSGSTKERNLGPEIIGSEKAPQPKKVQAHKGPGASAMIVLTLALVVLISSRQRRI